ncbi:hypothetical protein EIN_200780 [Entamoeba invadens IP1]|uniref:Uncharacterized protein n=1 Tax=Entamoeba invadens IP1 TaxID=370355 RepID=L7FJ46_ENTIV|nr:hypothetical protein EIN_200780 [Entamoeba invadens IP1]ELP83640.1 hypothetical protein EIN_200780 [Entamoeba invadens IP1]|eukprot:XP_004182986.1 hypothetical protein EIN_200780 [Entamoeba invadens IP1]
MDNYKIAVLGECGVGKTLLLNNFTDNPSDDSDDYQKIENDFPMKIVSYKDEEIVLSFIETSYDKYPSMHETNINQTDSFVLIFSITSRKSFEQIPTLRNDILRVKTLLTNEKLTLVLCGNKSDLEHMREVTTKEGLQMADKFGCVFYEISAKNNTNIDEMFNALINEAFNNKVNKIQNQYEITYKNTKEDYKNNDRFIYTPTILQEKPVKKYLDDYEEEYEEDKIQIKNYENIENLENENENQSDEITEKRKLNKCLIT